MAETLTADEAATLRAMCEGLNRRVDVLETQRDPAEAVDQLVQVLTDSPGVVTDEGLARATPCDCIALGGGEECFSKGVKGVLDEGQKALFCNPRVVRGAT